MAEETEVVETTPAEVDTTAVAKEVETLKANLLKEENIKKQLIAERDKLKGDLKKVNDEKLVSSGDIKKQLEAKELELSELSAKLPDLEKEAEEARQFKADTIKELMAQLPDDEDIKTLAEGMDIAKLKLLVKKHSVKGATEVHNGNGGADVKLTDKQKEEARAMNLDDKGYLKVMAVKNKEKENK
jgi:hypothetical protein